MYTSENESTVVGVYCRAWSDVENADRCREDECANRHRRHFFKSIREIDDVNGVCMYECSLTWTCLRVMLSM